MKVSEVSDLNPSFEALIKKRALPSMTVLTAPNSSVSSSLTKFTLVEERVMFTLREDFRLIQDNITFKTSETQIKINTFLTSEMASLVRESSMTTLRKLSSQKSWVSSWSRGHWQEQSVLFSAQ